LHAVIGILRGCRVLCLRTNQTQWDAATLWRTYTTLTDLEAVFRALKSELGLRPIYHHKTERVSAHLFISVLAYHLVHAIRLQLKACGIHLSWDGIRRELDGQDRVTVELKREDGRAREHSRFLADGRRYWQCAKCRAQCTVCSGTLFHATKLPLTKWFQASAHLVSDGCASFNAAGAEVAAHGAIIVGNRKSSDIEPRRG
jgi:hypothetical protein